MRVFPALIISTFAIILLFCTSSVLADRVAIGHVSLTILNVPPRITTVRIVPDTVYTGTIPTCEATVEDNGPVVVTYTWNADPSSLDAGDALTCTAVAKDEDGALSESMTSSVVIRAVPVSTRVVKMLLSGVGVEEPVHEVVELQRAGMGAVTGRIVSEVKSTSGTSLLGVLLVILAVNVLVLLRLVLKRRVRAAS